MAASYICWLKSGQLQARERQDNGSSANIKTCLQFDARPY